MPLHLTLDPVCVKPSLSYGFANCSPSDDNDTLVAVDGQCCVHCDMGYTLQGSNGTIYCLPNGSWSHQADCILVMHATTHISIISTTVPAFDGTVHTSNSKSSANRGAIAGGIIASILLLIGLLTVAIVLLWCYRKRLGGVLHLGTPSLSKSISLSFLASNLTCVCSYTHIGHDLQKNAYSDVVTKADHIYYSIDKTDGTFKVSYCYIGNE